MPTRLESSINGKIHHTAHMPIMTHFRLPLVCATELEFASPSFEGPPVTAPCTPCSSDTEKRADRRGLGADGPAPDVSTAAVAEVAGFFAFERVARALPLTEVAGAVSVDAEFEAEEEVGAVVLVVSGRVCKVVSTAVLDR